MGLVRGYVLAEVHLFQLQWLLWRQLETQRSVLHRNFNPLCGLHKLADLLAGLGPRVKQALSLHFLLLAAFLSERDIPDLGGVLIGQPIEHRITFISLFTPAAVYSPYLLEDPPSSLPAVIAHLRLYDLDMAGGGRPVERFCCGDGVSRHWGDVELRRDAGFGDGVLEELIFGRRVGGRGLEGELDIGLVLDRQRSHLLEITLLLNLYKAGNNLATSKQS